MHASADEFAPCDTTHLIADQQDLPDDHDGMGAEGVDDEDDDILAAIFTDDEDEHDKLY